MDRPVLCSLSCAWLKILWCDTGSHAVHRVQGTYSGIAKSLEVAGSWLRQMWWALVGPITRHAGIGYFPGLRVDKDLGKEYQDEQVEWFEWDSKELLGKMLCR